MRMKLIEGKTKVLTLSYDDGVVQDARLIQILNQYGLKATFNINSGLYLAESTNREKIYGRMKRSEAKKLYVNSGHEVAIHSLTHPFLDKLDSAELIYEIIEDRKNIESDFEVIARGLAYPYGAYNDGVVDVLEKCHIAYARTTVSTHKFGFPENWLMLHPTCHHNDEKRDELIKRFVEVEDKWSSAEMFYLWGHSYKFDNDDNWEVIEKFAEYASDHEHIWYATNIEVYDYVQAYKSLRTSFDKKIITNPSSVDVWFEFKGEVYCVKSGETIRL